MTDIRRKLNIDRVKTEILELKIFRPYKDLYYDYRVVLDVLPILGFEETKEIKSLRFRITK